MKTWCVKDHLTGHVFKVLLDNEQFQEFLKKNNINAESSGSSFAKNHGVNTKVNPLQKNALLYDTSQFTEEFINKVQKAQVKSGVGTEFARDKFPPLTSTEKNKPRLDAIEVKGGVKKNDPYAGKRGSGIELGHTGNIFGTELITGDKLAYTPTEINQLMGKKGNLDDKIRSVSQKIEKIKGSNKPANVVKDLLEQADNILIRLASQSQGFKKVTLSGGGTFGGDRLTIDPFDTYPGKTEKEIQKIQKKYLGKEIITEGSKKTPAAEIQKIQDAFFFEKNRKEVMKASKKIDKKEIKKVKENVNLKFKAETGKTGKINPKEMSRLRDVINDAVGELACGDKLAGGGRIKFSSGSSCNVRGRKILTDAVRNGISSIEPSKQNLVKKILSGSANLVRGVLDPKELFKLKNLIGFPAAVAAAVFDTAMVADDMIRKGQPFDEAAGNEMLAGMLNLQPQVQEAKRVLADPKSSLSPAAKKYAEMLVDIGEYNNTLQTKNIPMKTVGMPGDPKEQKMLEKKLDALEKKISGTSTSGELDYLKEITERDAKDKAGSYVGEGGNEYGYTRTNALYDDPDKTDAPSFFSGQLKPSYGDLEQKPGQLPGYATKMIPAYVSQNYKTMEEQPITKDWLNVITQIKRKQGELGANQNLDDIKYMNERFIKNNEGVPTKQKVKGLSMLDEMQLQNKWMQALSQPGIKGTQFSEGGITELRSKYEYKK